MAKGALAAPREVVPTSVPSRDVLNRLNFLYQASIILAGVVPPRTAAPVPSERTQPAAARERRRGAAGPPKGEGRFIPTQPLPVGPVPGGAPVPTVDTETAGLREARAVSPSSNFPVASTPTLGPSPATVTSRDLAGTGPLPKVSRMLVQLMKEVAKKGTVRMDPSLKRTLCKGCHEPLIPGLTSQTRIKGPHAHLIVQTCWHCLTTLRLPAPPLLPPPAPLAVSDSVHPSLDPPLAGAEERSTPKASRWDRRERRRMRNPVHFEREGHIVIAGEQRIQG